jgi:hypothetical protein
VKLVLYGSLRAGSNGCVFFLRENKRQGTIFSAMKEQPILLGKIVVATKSLSATENSMGRFRFQTCCDVVCQGNRCVPRI